LFAPPAATVVPQNPSVSSQPDPATKFGLQGGALLNGLGLAALAVTAGASRPMHQRLDAAAAAIEPKMIGWRRDFHQHPELGNQEVYSEHRRAPPARTGL
jgi:hypothetical protein